MANWASTRARGTQWKARSHAAYHGYSHLSGMEMTSALLRWRHSWLRPYLRCVGWRGQGRVTLEPAVDVEVEELLGPQHPGQGLAQHPRLVCARARRCEGVVELVGLPLSFGHRLLPVAVHGAAVGRQSEPELGWSRRLAP